MGKGKAKMAPKRRNANSFHSSTSGPAPELLYLIPEQPWGGEIL